MFFYHFLDGGLCELEVDKGIEIDDFSEKLYKILLIEAIAFVNYRFNQQYQ